MIAYKNLVWLTATLSVILTAACSAPQSSSVDEGISPQKPGGAATSAVPPSDRRPNATLPDGQIVTLELALTPEEQMRGLMYRPSLPGDRGMLFVHQQAIKPTMWMKHTLISLDLIFLDGEGVVVALHENAQPCPTEPCPQFKTSEPTTAVLELAGGSSSSHGIQVGTRIEFAHVQGYPTTALE